MKEDLVTTKIALDALRLLRIIAAATNEKQYVVLTRLIDAEVKRLARRGIQL